MKGNVIGFDRDTNTGAISGHDGNRYDFVTADWHSNRQPMRGDVVLEWHDHYVASATTPAGSTAQFRLARAKA